jgi:hypothetical protein
MIASENCKVYINIYIYTHNFLYYYFFGTSSNRRQVGSRACGSLLLPHLPAANVALGASGFCAAAAPACRACLCPPAASARLRLLLACAACAPMCWWSVVCAVSPLLDINIYIYIYIQKNIFLYVYIHIYLYIFKILDTSKTRGLWPVR